MEDKCPFCGAEDKSWSSRAEDHCHWLGKYAEDLKNVRSPYCYERQLATLTAENQRLRDKIISDIWRPSPFFSDTLICRYCGMQKSVIEREGKHRDDCLITFITPTPAGEWVTVNRKDLEKAVDFMENTASTYWIEIANRLKDALGGKE